MDDTTKLVLTTAVAVSLAVLGYLAKYLNDVAIARLESYVVGSFLRLKQRQAQLLGESRRLLG